MTVAPLEREEVRSLQRGDRTFEIEERVANINRSIWSSRFRLVAYHVIR